MVDHVDLKQFKLTNDEEIICEVMVWNDRTTDDIVVRRALRIVSLDDPGGSMRYYTFKPWMLMNNDPDSIHVLNSNHIISESSPTKIAMEYYYDVLKEMTETDDEPEIFDLSNYEDEDSDGESTKVYH